MLVKKFERRKKKNEPFPLGWLFQFFSSPQRKVQRYFVNEGEQVEKKGTSRTNRNVTRKFKERKEINKMIKNTWACLYVVGNELVRAILKSFDVELFKNLFSIICISCTPIILIFFFLSLSHLICSFQKNEEKKKKEYQSF